MAAPTASLWGQRTLDCPKFAALLDNCGLNNEGAGEHMLIDDEQERAEYRAVRQEYEDLWRRHLVVSLVKEAFAMGEADRDLIQALVTTEGSLGSLCQSDLQASLADGLPRVVTACNSLLARLLSLSKLLFPPLNDVADDAHRFEDIIIQVHSTVRDTDEHRRQARFCCVQVMAFLANASLHLVDIVEQATRLTQSMTPLARSYAETFARYISSVAESLDLKLRIIGRETMLHALSIGLNPECNLRASQAAQSMIAEVEAATRQAETNLLLLRQLGPSLESIARQYQQVVSQLALVKEDLANLLQ